jgi:hypothetical protein
MRKIYFVVVGGLLSSMAFMANAECTMATCDAAKGATTCEREIAIYNACVDREAQARWSAGKVGKQDLASTGDATSRESAQKANPVTAAASDKKPESLTAPKEVAASSAR